MTDSSKTRTKEIITAQVDDAPALQRLGSAFAANNPGYALAYHKAVSQLPSNDKDRVVFVQGPTARMEEPTMGDILLLRAGEAWQIEGNGTLDLLEFSLPDSLPEDLPKMIRPDWDPRITDTPGGCATDSDAYRRVLLTWKPEVGPYILHALNAHRVRINDSFSHYHPLVGGFDEFYLVQEAPEGAMLHSSSHVEAIEQRELEAGSIAGLIRSQRLHEGELVYIPRGTMHRGLGGALVHVISVPGFKPNAEIGLDHHLRAINEAHGLHGDQSLPFNWEASHQAVVK